MSQLSPAPGARGRAAGDGVGRGPWGAPIPTSCKDILQVLVPVSWALRLGSMGLVL